MHKVNNMAWLALVKSSKRRFQEDFSSLLNKSIHAPAIKMLDMEKRPVALSDCSTANHETAGSS